MPVFRPIQVSAMQHLLCCDSLVSRFGWFGMNAEEVAKPLLNYIGAGLSVVRYVAMCHHLILPPNIKNHF